MMAKFTKPRAWRIREIKATPDTSNVEMLFAAYERFRDRADSRGQDWRAAERVADQLLAVIEGEGFI